jgi:pSer/pThr/pTyr-binding forkhead associated (FHA) protein
MNPLKNLETMLANLVEGTFGRVFRSEVRPMELARRLTREMDAHRTQSVSRVYAPNEYAVWLSPEDRALYEGVEHDLIEELCAYLLEHARRENLMLASPPRIAFHTDERLTLGEFGIEVGALRSEEPEAEHPREQHPREQHPREQHPREQHPRELEEVEERGETMIYSSSQRIGGAVMQARARRSSRAVLVVAGKRVLVPPPGAVLGRSRECDIVLEDPGVSRRHAEIRPTEEDWVLADLGSTNGVRVNDRPLRGKHVLQLGDRIELGSTELVFEVR